MPRPFIAVTIVDPSDDTTPILALDDRDSTTTTLPAGVRTEVRELNLGTAPLRVERISGQSPGGMSAVIGDGLTEMSWRQMILMDPFDYDTALEVALEIEQLLRAGGVILFQAKDATDPVLIDFEPSEGMALYDGDPRQFVEGGLPISIVRQPGMRDPAVAVVSAESISNGTLDGAVVLTNPGNRPSPARVAVEVAGASAEVAQVVLGLRAQDDADEFRSLYQFAPPSPSAVQTTRSRIFRKVIQPTDAAALRGTFQIRQALRLLSRDVYDLQLGYATTTEEPTGSQGPVVSLDSTDTAVWPELGEIVLGYVSFDGLGESLVIEVYARSEAGGNIAWGPTTLMPADTTLIDMRSPGQGRGDFGGQLWRGSDLTTTGELEDDVVYLTEQGQTAETEEFQVPPGILVARFGGRVKNLAQVKAKIGEFRIIVGGSTAAVSDLRSLRGQTWNGWNARKQKRAVISHDGSGAIKLQVEYTAVTDEGKQIRVRRFRRTFIPVVGDGRSMVLDTPEHTAYITDSAGARWWPAEPRGELWVPPGTWVLVTRLGEGSNAATYFDSDPRGPVARAEASVAGAITVELVPMRSH
jgi:hypothetical protein